MEYETSAGIVVVNNKGKNLRFLLLHYPAGHWSFPKGHIESGESLKITAKRETKEETGLEIDLIDGFKEPIHYQYQKNGRLMQKTVYFFIGTSENKEVKLSHEHEDFVWLPYKEALERLTYNNGKRILKKAHEFLQK